MFYDQNQMIELYQNHLLKNKKRNKGFQTILLTSRIQVHTFVSETELIQLHHKWTKQLKTILSEEDAAYILNSGNVFLLIHDSQFESFKEKTKSLKVASDTRSVELSSFFMMLEEEEAEFLLTLPI